MTGTDSGALWHSESISGYLCSPKKRWIAVPVRLPTQDYFSLMFPCGLDSALLGKLLFAGTTPVLFASLLTPAAIYHRSLCLKSRL